MYQKQRRSGNLDYTMLNVIMMGISGAVNSAKFQYHDYFAKKLNNPKATAKTYESIFKTFVNGSKIPLIPPTLGGD